MTIYNIMTCQNLSYDILGGCTMGWATIVIVLFLAMILRRQCADGFLSGTGFNLWGALGLGLGLDILLITFTGEARWALVAGIAGIAIGGFVIGMFIDNAEGGGDYE